METLFKFETEGKQKSSTNVLVDRIFDNLIPNLNSKKTPTTIIKLEDFGDTPILQINMGTKSILTIPWIRPYLPNKTLSKALLDYPRLNVLKVARDCDRKEDKISNMLRLVKKYQMYFLVMLQKPNGADLYWLEKYENIPVKYWKLTSRRKKEGLGRIIFPGYVKYNFIRIEKLKKQINAIIKDEN
jgi:hypothetical protein